MTTDYRFEGWLGKDKESVQRQMAWGAFEPKKWEEHDVDSK
jgi:alcohol dehydrogenase (NADP+)